MLQSLALTDKSLVAIALGDRNVTINMAADAVTFWWYRRTLLLHYLHLPARQHYSLACYL
jgi:hypothetical protein